MCMRCSLLSFFFSFDDEHRDLLTLLETLSATTQWLTSGSLILPTLSVLSSHITDCNGSMASYSLSEEPVAGSSKTRSTHGTWRPIPGVTRHLWHRDGATSPLQLLMGICMPWEDTMETSGWEAARNTIQSLRNGLLLQTWPRTGVMLLLHFLTGRFTSSEDFLWTLEEVLSLLQSVTERSTSLEASMAVLPSHQSRPTILLPRPGRWWRTWTMPGVVWLPWQWLVNISRTSRNCHSWDYTSSDPSFPFHFMSKVTHYLVSLTVVLVLCLN